MKKIATLIAATILTALLSFSNYGSEISQYGINLIDVLCGILKIKKNGGGYER